MIVEISIPTVEALGRVITSTRTGPELVLFFNQFGSQDVYGHGFPSRGKYTQSKIIELNKTEQTISLIEKAVDPRNFFDTEFEVGQIVADLNKVLQYDGYELINEGLHYRVRRKLGEVLGGNPVKNLIFASTGQKPEIVLRDALNNDIEIVKNAEYCLIYDNPISDEGLLWQNLVQWWARLKHQPFPSEETERNLYARLAQSLASQPEKILFKSYYGRFRSEVGANIPALIPQVYLHYDPKTFHELDGKPRLPRQRMDFLMLLPRNYRIVIEVDGKHHYADGDTPSPRKYAEMAAADRDLRLAGYEVYRFGGYELDEKNGERLAQQFFEKLLHKHSLLTEQ